MKKIGRAMSIAMGIAMSFCLSLVGTLSSGHFTVVAFLTSFGASLIVSLMIGFLVPIQALNGRVCGKMPRNSMKRRCIETLISDLVYTPLMTFLMVSLAYFSSRQHGGSMPFLPTFLKSLLLSLAVGYVMIFVLQPLFLKKLLKKNGIMMQADGPPQRIGSPEQH